LDGRRSGGGAFAPHAGFRCGGRLHDAYPVLVGELSAEPAGHAEQAEAEDGKKNAMGQRPPDSAASWRRNRKLRM
jgi:hypothetical protein